MDKITYILEDYEYYRVCKNVWTKTYWPAGIHALVKNVPSKDVPYLEEIYRKSL